MTRKKFKKYLFQKGDSFYVVEEDLVGWYLIVFKKHNAAKSSEDFLLDTFEDALIEAKDRFDISRHGWVSDEN